MPARRTRASRAKGPGAPPGGRAATATIGAVEATGAAEAAPAPAGDLALLYRGLLERSPLPAVGTAGAAHVVRWANAAYCRLIGAESTALLGRPLSQSVPDAAAPGVPALLDRVYRTGEAASVAEWPPAAAERGQLAWLANVWPVLDTLGHPAGLILQGSEASGQLAARRRDEQAMADARAINEQLLIAGIREQERAEEAMRRSELRFRSLVQHASDIIAIVNLDGTIRYLSPAVERMLGRRAEELLGTSSAVLVHPDDLARIGAMMREVISTPGATGSLEVRLRHRDGSWRDAEAIAHNLRDEPGIGGLVINFRDVSERKRAEAALRESESRYRAVVESQTELVCRYLPDTTLTFVNEAYCRYFGQPREQLLGRPFLALVPKAEWEAVRRQVDAVVRCAGVATYEHEVLLPDGTVGWQQWTDSAITGPDGTVVEIQAVGRDISERVRAEVALRESEERYRRLVESSPETVAVLVEGKIAYINPAGARLLGAAAPEELLGRPILDFVHPSSRATAEARLRAIAAARQPTPLVEQRAVRLDGRVIDAETMATPITYRGQPAVQVIFRDIGERKRAEEAIRFQARLLDQVRAAVVATDVAGVVTHWNAGAERLYGWSREEALGRPLAELTVGSEDATVVAAITARLRAGGRWEGELPMRRPDGATFPAYVVNAPVYDAEEQLIGISGVSIDLSERKRIEAELATARRQLASSREEERLRLARELHDGPVQQLLGISYQLAALAPSGPPGAPAPPAPDAIRREVLEVATTLRGLIGELRPAGLEEFGLPTALEGYVARLRSERPGAQPEIVLEVEPGVAALPSPVALDLFRCAQEALQNALRHARARRITVTVGRQRDRALLCVRDDGRGFDVPPRLVGLTQAGHFGLAGLAERVELAGGRHDIQSAPGAGTTVRVSLPALADPMDGGDDDPADPGAAG